MPLQIRRGTELQRTSMTQPLAAGELLFVTSPTNRIYVGDGTTLGGIAVTGYTDENAQDAVAPMFTGGSHSGINFVYNDASNIINATVDLSNYNGTIRASSFKGTLVADDSTALVDAVDGRIFLDGTVKGNIVPDADVAYDLGSATYRFRDLYLSGSSIKLGAATITSTGTAVNLPAGSTIGGSAIGIPGGDLNVNIVADDSTVIVNTTTEVVTAQGGFVGNVTGNTTGTHTGAVIGNVTGNVTGNTNGLHTGDVKGSVFADDSTVLVDGPAGVLKGLLIGSLSGNVTGNINGVVTGTAGSSLIGNLTGNSSGTHTGAVIGNVTGNTDGFHTGSVKGSVFGEDSSQIIDAHSRTIYGSLETPFITVSDSKITATNTTILLQSSTTQETVNITGITDGTFGVNNAGIAIKGSKGTILAPTNTGAGDVIGGIKVLGYRSGVYTNATSILTGWDATVNFADPLPKSNLYFTVGGGSTVQTAVFSCQGALYAPVLMCGSYAGSGTYPAIAAEGYIIFDSTTKRFMGYTGTVGGWKQLDN